MKNIELNNLIIEGIFNEGIRIGLTKWEIEKVLGKPLENADIETPDLYSYYIRLASGILVSIQFDKNNICFEINLNFEENNNLNFILKFDDEVKILKENTTFENIIDIFFKLNVEWEFDKTRTYLQTLCIRLESGLRLYYAFGKRKENDYGLFSIKSILETHRFAIL